MDARRAVTVRTPPLEAVQAVLAALRDAGLDPVVGGSAVLAAHGAPVAEVRDWDVLVDADAELVWRALAALPHAVERASGDPDRFASEALMVVDVPGAKVDVIVRFAIRTESGVVEVPARRGTWWLGLPVARADDWVRAYRAMGRDARADTLAGVTTPAD